LRELKLNPRAYRERPECRGLRCCWVEEYSVWYAVRDQTIVVVRILPPRMDSRVPLMHP